MRYRNVDAANVSRVGINVQATDYNVAPLPPATYGMYESGAGTSADPFENFEEPNPTMTPASFSGMVDFRRMMVVVLSLVVIAWSLLMELLVVDLLDLILEPLIPLLVMKLVMFL